MKAFKALALLLAAVILIVPSALALENDNCSCGYDPMIFVDGFAQTNLTYAAGTAEEQTAFFPGTDVLVPALLKAVFPILKLCITGDYNSFSDSFAPLLHEIFDKVRCDYSGEPIYTLTPPENRTDSAHSPYRDYDFHYDWRLDIKTLATQLNDYIEEVKTASGHDKVVLRPVSMGGAITLTYLHLYGHESVSAIVFTSSAACGLTLVDKLFTGTAVTSGDALAGYVKDFIQGKSTDATALRCLITTLHAAGVFDVISNVLNRFLSGYSGRMYEDFMFDYIGNIPGPWCFVTSGAYEQAKEFMLDKTENAALIEKIDFYHYDVFPNMESLLKGASEDGVKLGVISHYGLYGAPAVEDCTVQTDFLVDTRHTSIGATCAPLGETLGDGYTQQLYPEKDFLSDDGVIDASTCMFPEYTWFVKGMMHTWFTASYTSLVCRIAYADSQLTVFDDKQYQQFLLYDDDADTLTPITAQDGELYGDFELTFNSILSKLTAARRKVLG